MVIAKMATTLEKGKMGFLPRRAGLGW
jgi:hypothetical protein